MSFTLGRLSSTRNPTSWSQTGDTVDFTFDILPSSLTVAKAFRQQLLGMPSNTDEPVVPFTLSIDGDHDGYYRISSTDATPVQAYQRNYLVRCRVRMDRVGGYYKPLIELHASCAQIFTDHTLTTYGRVAHPQDDIEDYNAGTGFGEYAVGREVAVDGGRVRWTRVPSLPATGVVSYYVPPASHYIGAATLEVQRDSVWYPVSGRQVPKLDTAGAWRLSNGLVRITPSGTHNYLVQVFDTSWVDLVTVQRGFDDLSLIHI